MPELHNSKIEEFCDLIFINNDTLDFTKFQSYIDNHINDEIKLIDNKYDVRTIVRTKVIDYIQNCRANEFPMFSFASDNNFHMLRVRFEEYYRSQYRKVHQADSEFPIAFVYMFEFIQEIIDSHTLFEEFSIQMTREAIDVAIEEASKASESAMLSAKVSAKIAEKAASQAAITAADAAIEQVVKDKKIEGYAKKIVDEQIVRVTKNISETSVTILGIFAGIVLTVVAGLFYSSSVLENINSANFCRLLSVAALVGLVCFNLIALMFRYIERIRNSSSSTPRFDNITRFFTWFLIIVMVVCGILQFWIPDSSTANLEKSEIDINLSSSISEETNSATISNANGEKSGNELQQQEDVTAENFQ